MSEPIAKCAWCGQEPAPLKTDKRFIRCWTDGCAACPHGQIPEDWNHWQGLILATRRADYEAGQTSVGWRDDTMQRIDGNFDDYLARETKDYGKA